MEKINIINLLGNGNIGKELKRALSFMLLSRGYTPEEIKVLDDYDFSVSKKSIREASNNKLDSNVSHIRRKQRSLPKNPVCLTSTSEAYNKRDHTLYSLNNHEPVTKGRLVWSVVKLYQEIFSPTFEEVSQLFNQKLNLLGYTVKNGERIIQVDLKQSFESGCHVGTACVKIVAGAAESAESFCRNAFMDDSGEISYGNDRPRP